jgi:hypothetical protein
MMRQFIIVIATISVGGFALAQNIPALFDRPGGLVPNQRTAIVIAEAVLFQSTARKPFAASGPMS